MGIPLSASVHDALAMHRRSRHRSEIYKLIEEAILRVSGRNGDDVHLWSRRAGFFVKDFSNSHMWQQVRAQGQRVFWFKLVWFSQATPKFAFITWLAFHNRLSTMDRIKIWNAAVDDTCVRCTSASETKYHLFFDCSFSSGIWAVVMGNLMGAEYSTNWNRIIAFLLNARLDRDKRFIVRYVFHAVLYAIWMERNNRRHGKTPQAQSVLIRMLDKGIHNKISSMREKGLFWMDRGLQIWFSAH